MRTSSAKGYINIKEQSNLMLKQKMSLNMKKCNIIKRFKRKKKKGQHHTCFLSFSWQLQHIWKVVCEHHQRT